MVVLGMVVGICLSWLCGVIPGIHGGLACLIALALLGSSHPDLVLGIILGIIGGGLWLELGGKILNPMATWSGYAHQDAAVKLAMRGQGDLAYQLSKQAITKATIMSLILLAIFSWSITFVGVDNSQQLVKTIKLLSPVAIIIWIAILVHQQGPLVLTSLLITGSWGYLMFNSSLTRGSSWSVALLMIGLIAIPALVDKLLEASSGATSPIEDALHPQRPKGKSPDYSLDTSPPEPDPKHIDHYWLGAILGAISGAFAGLGTSSVVSTLGSQTDDNEDYVALGASADASNSLISVLLLVHSRTAHSSEAVALDQLTTSPLLVLAGLVACTITGYLLSDSAFKLTKTLIPLLKYSIYISPIILLWTITQAGPLYLTLPLIIGGYLVRAVTKHHGNQVLLFSMSIAVLLG